MTRRRFRRVAGVFLIIASLGVAMIPTGDVIAEETKSTSTDFSLNGSTLVKYTGTATTVSVPSAVKIIGSEAFVDNSEMKTIKLPSGLESIDYAAFAGCNHIYIVEIPDTCENLSTASFSNCPELKEFRLGTGVKKIGTGVFVGDGELSSIHTAGNEHFTCEDGVLYDKEKTTIVEVLQGRKSDSYTMPSTVTDIYPYAFYGCSRINTINISTNLKEIPAYAFSNCNGLTKVTIPYSVNAIDMKAFENNVNLTDVEIPISVTFIHDTAFDGCPGLNIIAPEGSYAYKWFEKYKKRNADIVDAEDNTGNKGSSGSGSGSGSGTGSASGNQSDGSGRVEIDGLLSETIIVGRQAFFIIDNSKQTVYGNDNSGPVNTDYSEIIADMEGVLQAETNGKGLSLPKFSIIGEEIASKAFYGNTALTFYEIPEEITSIGDFAFARSNISSITIPESVTHIGYGAFYHCDNLAKILVPGTVTEIEPAAFDNTRMMENWLNYGSSDFLIMGDGILVAYKGYNSTVSIPDTVKQIGPEAFIDNKYITELYLPDSVERICEDAFSGCINLKSVRGGMNLKRIDDRAFAGCPLETIRIVDTVEQIGLGAFNLKDTVLPEGNKVAVFQGDTLPTVIYGKTATRLSNTAFRTDSLTDVKVAIVNSESVNRVGTILDRNYSGFSGLVCVISGENNEYFNGTLKIIDCTLTADEAARFSVPKSVYAYGKGYNFDQSELESVLAMAESGAYSKELDEGDTVSFEGSPFKQYILDINFDEGVDAGISEAYARIYSEDAPLNLTTFDISLRPVDSEVYLTKFGKQKMTVSMNIPTNIPTKNLHVICTDDDGQLEDLPYRVVNDNDTLKIRFDMTHTGKYGLYAYSTNAPLPFNLDSSPDTGDRIHPKWFLCIGLMAIGLALLLIRNKEKAVA